MTRSCISQRASKIPLLCFTPDLSIRWPSIPLLESDWKPLLEITHKMKKEAAWHVLLLAVNANKTSHLNTLKIPVTNFDPNYVNSVRVAPVVLQMHLIFSLCSCFEFNRGDIMMSKSQIVHLSYKHQSCQSYCRLTFFRWHLLLIFLTKTSCILLK